MDLELKNRIELENKRRVNWGFGVAILCALLWGIGYAAAEVSWYIPPFDTFEAFPEGAEGMLVATCARAAVYAIVAFAVINTIWLGTMGKIGDFSNNIKKYHISKWYLIGAGLGGPFAAYGTDLAIGYVGAGFAAAASILTALVGAFAAKLWYGENITSKAWIGIGVLFIGGILILNPINLIYELRNPAAPDGLWMGYLGGFAATIGWGLEGAIAGRVLDVSDSDLGVAMRLFYEAALWTVLITPIFALIFGVDVMITAIVATATSIPYIFWTIITIMTLGLSYVFLYKSYPLIGVGRGMSISTTYVLFAILSLYIFLGSATDLWIIAGAAVAGAGVFIMYWDSGESLLESTRTGEE
ncbi:DMT family transporter [Methanolobus sp. ZRKC2]|uniref:hypothetical protein n=1 Tax=Methanolobus sp. ZRKC2 TaxID=3125783 RepID=UPI003247AACE